ncbi:MAG: YbaN family protein [Candidatus Bathyarchaeia archaeon]|jgi:uncharacterized membrane protein YbaN (DUF454 family)
MTQPEADKTRSIKNALLVAAGTICVCLGAIGIVLPILPTTPFLLLAAACYLRGSERMYHWLLTNRWFGTYIKNYHEGKGMSARGKIFTLTLLWVTILYSALFVVNSWIIQVVLFCVCIGVTAHLLKIPTYRETKTLTASNNHEIMNLKKKKTKRSKEASKRNL